MKTIKKEESIVTKATLRYMVRGPANERNSVTKNQGTKGDRMNLINNSIIQ